MPSNLLQADVGFPQFKEEQKPDEKINQVVNYLYMLLEQLRYSFGNLDADNFSESGIEELQTLLTEPIYARIESDEGFVNEFAARAEGFFTRLYDPTNGDIINLTLTASGLSGRMTTVEGATADLALTANGLYYQVWGVTPDDPQPTYSRITDSANKISQKVWTGDIQSEISTFAGSIELSVVNGSDSSEITLSGNGISAQATGTIEITGMVRFSNLSTVCAEYDAYTTYNVGQQVAYNNNIYTCIQAGRGKTPSSYPSYWTLTRPDTIINGGNITTGTVMANHIMLGGLMTVYQSNSSMSNIGGYLGYASGTFGTGGIGFTSTDLGSYVAAINSSSSGGGAKLHGSSYSELTKYAEVYANAGGIGLQYHVSNATGDVSYLYFNVIQGTGFSFHPGSDNGAHLGGPNHHFANAYITDLYVTNIHYE